MAALLTGYAETGLTTAKFVRRRKSDGAFWNTSGTPAFQSFASGNIAQYGIAATETGATGIYTATDPAEGTEGDCVLVKAAGASLVVSDLISGARWQDAAGGLSLAAAGLDNISTTGPSGVASTFREMLVQTWRYLFKKSTMTTTQLKTFADDGTTATTTATMSDDGITQTKGAAT